jgi:hypothetical protein
MIRTEDLSGQILVNREDVWEVTRGSRETREIAETDAMEIRRR